MQRSRLAGLLVALVVVCVSPAMLHAQIQEECMDCLEKLTVTEHQDGTVSAVSEALCCDAPCFGGYEMSQEDVGWACRTKPISGMITGTVCDSGTEDLGCPPPTPPEPITLCDDPSRNDGTCSPIIINLSDGPWKLSGADDPVSFDIDADGQPNRITWTGRGEPLAFLALDRNANGSIDDGVELFGTASRLRSGQRAPNGFEALKERDANNDGVIDATDPVWNSLLLWTDSNHNGLSEAGEISPIANSEVVALRTDCLGVQRRDSSGNTFRYMSSLRLDRGQRLYYDIFFRSVR